METRKYPTEFGTIDTPGCAKMLETIQKLGNSYNDAVMRLERMAQAIDGMKIDDVEDVSLPCMMACLATYASASATGGKRKFDPEEFGKLAVNVATQMQAQFDAFLEERNRKH